MPLGRRGRRALDTDVAPRCHAQEAQPHARAAHPPRHAGPGEPVVAGLQGSTGLASAALDRLAAGCGAGHRGLRESPPGGTLSLATTLAGGPLRLRREGGRSERLLWEHVLPFVFGFGLGGGSRQTAAMLLPGPLRRDRSPCLPAWRSPTLACSRQEAMDAEAAARLAQEKAGEAVGGLRSTGRLARGMAAWGRRAWLAGRLPDIPPNPIPSNSASQLSNPNTRTLRCHPRLPQARPWRRLLPRPRSARRRPRRPLSRPPPTSRELFRLFSCLFARVCCMLQ